MKNLVLGMSMMVGAALAVSTSGCTSLIPPQTIAFELNEGAGLVFPVTACEPIERTVTLTFDSAGLNITSGTFELKPEDITLNVDVEQPGKSAVAGQNTCDLTVEGRVAATGQEADVCTSTDDYGPYVVTLDDDFMITGIDPATITLSEATISVLDTGTVTVCLEVTAPFSGTVTISALTFNVNLTLN